MKLYLNTMLSKLGTQLVRILVVNHVEPQTSGTLQIERPVVDEDALLRRALCDLESNPKDGFFGLARTNVARAEEDGEIAAEMKRCDTVLVELEVLVIDGADEVFAAARGVGEDRAGIWIFFGLGKHKGREFFARKRTRSVKEGAVEIFIQRDMAGIESGEGQIVAVLKFFVVEMESVGRSPARATVPAVGQDDSANVPEEGGDLSQVRGTSRRAAKTYMIDVSPQENT
jgi:hypothetical protein